MDWTLLVDGQADPQHVHVQHDIDRRLSDLGTEFQRGLTELFFRSNNDLTEATQRYGVF
jgi:hypothetical protein